MPGLLDLAIVFAFGWFAMGWWPCGGCWATCYSCPSSKASPTYKIVIDGFESLYAFSCPNCDDYNGTYFVPFSSEWHNFIGNQPVQSSCKWYLEEGLPNTCGHPDFGPNYLQMHIQDPGVGLLVTLVWSTGQFTYWQDNTFDEDCDALTDFDVAFYYTRYPTCYGSMPTCKLTSVP